jgi:hypothetical protein
MLFNIGSYISLPKDARNAVGLTDPCGAKFQTECMSRVSTLQAVGQPAPLPRQRWRLILSDDARYGGEGKASSWLGAMERQDGARQRDQAAQPHRHGMPLLQVKGSLVDVILLQAAARRQYWLWIMALLTRIRRVA